MHSIDLILDDETHLHSMSKPFLGAWIDGVLYIVIKYAEMQWLVKGKCPHRGGPLHLGEDTGDSIICPWHTSAIRKHLLIRSALPFLRTGNRIRVFTKEPSHHISALKRSTVLNIPVVASTTRPAHCDLSLTQETV